MESSFRMCLWLKRRPSATLGICCHTRAVWREERSGERARTRSFSVSSFLLLSFERGYNTSRFALGTYTQYVDEERRSRDRCLKGAMEVVPTHNVEIGG